MSVVELTRDRAATLVRRREVHRGSRMAAYYSVACDIGRSTAWLRRLISRGLTSVDAEVSGRIDAMLVRELEAEIARLQAELALARQSGAHPASQHIGEIEAHLAAVSRLMSGETE